MKKKKEIKLGPIRVGSVVFPHPFYVSSGPVSKSVDQLIRAEEAGWAGVSVKLTFDPEPYINLKPRYHWDPKKEALFFTAEKRLSVEESLNLVKEARQKTKKLIILANIAYTGEKGLAGWAKMAQRFEEAGCHIIELNFCCPNMSFNLATTRGKKSGVVPASGTSLGQQKEVVSLITEAVKKAVKVPVMTKLTGEGGRVAEVARAAIKAGADAVSTTGNRLGLPSFDLSYLSSSPYPGQKEPSMSCFSGGIVRPLSLRDLFEVRKALGSEPIIASTGGVVDAQTALESIMLGANLVGVCTAILTDGYEIIQPILKGIKKYLREKGYFSLREVHNLLVPRVTPASELTLSSVVARISPQLAPCQSACPLGIPTHSVLQLVASHEIRKAYQLISLFPGQEICSYVCVRRCEKECLRQEIDQSLNIREIKKFVLAYGQKKGWKVAVNFKKQPSRIKVAVIGSGPAGLSAAYYLTLFGYKVVVFEKEKVLGGTLRLIPPFRLPEEAIDREIEKLKNLGVEFRIRREWGREITLESLRKEGFKAVFLGIGGKEKDLEIKGRETVKGVFSASEFLKGVKERKRIKIGPRVVVIGGGFSAVDSARVARRAGAEEVFILYRRTKDEMPASLEEVAQAEKEGVRVMYLVAPVEIVSQEGQLKRLKLVNLTLGNEDETGRRKSEPVKGTEFFLTVDTLIKAVGQERVKVPSAPQLFTGGDLIQKQGNIVQALADGKKAAWAIDQFLKGDRKKEKKLKTVNPIFIREKYGYLPPQHRAEVDISEAPTAVFSFRKAVKEAGRCLNCGCGIGCGHCQKICPAEAIKEKNGFYEVDETKCEGCSMCYRVCFKKSIKLKI